MDKETLLKICNAIYAEGFEVGYEDARSDEYDLSDEIDEELKGLGFDIEKEKGCIYFLSDVQKQALRKSRIEKVLKKFGVNTTEGNNDYQGKTEALMNKIKELKEDALVRLNNNFYLLADMAKEIKETGFYPPIEEILAIAENLVFNTGEVSGLTDAIDVEVDND